jgi:hypothetical protein
MANAALIIAPAGTGKTTSIRNLDPKTTFIINVGGKSLPIQGWKKMYVPFSSKTKEGNYVFTSEAKNIVTVMEMVSRDMPHIKTIVIDDYQYMSAFEFMNKSHETGYQKFTDIAKNVFTTSTKYHELRDDLIVFYLTHPEISENMDGKEIIKAKTVGKLVDDKLVLEGLFTTVLYGRARRVGKQSEYFFETQTDGRTPAKSPMGMLDSFEIPNDLELVRQRMIAYEE